MDLESMLEHALTISEVKPTEQSKVSLDDLLSVQKFITPHTVEVTETGGFFLQWTKFGQSFSIEIFDRGVSLVILSRKGRKIFATNYDPMSSVIEAITKSKTLSWCRQ